MPSKKPQFVIRTEKEILQKIAHIAQENERTSTQEIVYLIKQRIKEYETEHGEIEIKETEKPELKIPLMDPFHTGTRVGETLADVVLNQINKKGEKYQQESKTPGKGK